MSYRKFTALFLCLSLFLLAGLAQQPQRRTADEYIKVLETERRIEGLQVQKVIETLKIKPGQRVGDLGAGSGLFARPIAKQLGEKGIVYAIDVDPGLLKHIEKTAAAEKITNIKTVLAAEDDAKLPEKVDLIVIIDTLHHIGNQGPYLKGLKKYLKPDGRVAIIDFSETWPAGHESMKYSLDQLEGWMKDAGFKRTEKHDFLNNNFFVIYK
ncbi:MAG TPA: methyltransferase domain-containing protein [Blastocatellia bacterium]|nr:methyltransferase domain-containing protein [Blastocatellia bacterium]